MPRVKDYYRQTPVRLRLRRRPQDGALLFEAGTAAPALTAAVGDRCGATGRSGGRSQRRPGPGGSVQSRAAIMAAAVAAMAVRAAVR